MLADPLLSVVTPPPRTPAACLTLLVWSTPLNNTVCGVEGLRPAIAQRAVSEACFSDIDKIDKDYDMLSDFSEEVDRQAMFSFFRLGQTDTLETGGLTSNIF